MVAPASKKAAVKYLISHFKISERRACWLLGLSRTAYRYCHVKSNDQALIARLKELAIEYPRYGYLMLHELLKREGLVMNRKRTYQLYKALGLQVRTKKRKKLIRPRVPMEVPSAVNQRWSVDFVSDQLANGRRFRVLNVVDDFDFRREVIGQLVAVSISGPQVARYVTQLVEVRGKPVSIVCDKGPEYSSKAMFIWSKDQQIKLSFIQPGKPTQNAFVERLNGKLRNECLNQHWFRTLAEARYDIELWRQHYNTVRPHSSLNYLSPSEFVKKAA